MQRHILPAPFRLWFGRMDAFFVVWRVYFRLFFEAIFVSVRFFAAMHGECSELRARSQPAGTATCAG